MRTSLVVTMIFLATACNAQQKPDETTAAKTKLDAFERQTGSVIIRGFTETGSVSGSYGGSVSVEARELTNATSGKKEYGIVIEVKEASRLERVERSYIDYDEIDPLLHGIDYIAKVQASATKLKDFEADYRTKGDLEVSTFSTGSGTMAAVKCGRIAGVTVIIKLESLGNLRELITQAKTTLDSVKGNA